MDSPTIGFVVYDSAPTGAWIWKNKEAVAVGEEISFNYNATNATSFTVGVDKLGTGRVRTEGTSDWYTTSFSEPGIYYIYATCYNAVGYADTPVETFVVYNNIGTNFTAPILNKNHWKPIENSNGTVQLADETGYANQLWYFEQQSDGSYKISSCYDGKCLDVQDSSSNPNAIVQTYISNDSNAQRWYIWEESGGYVLKPKCSSCVLDLRNGNSANGTPIITYTANYGIPQIWAIYQGDECKLSGASISVSAGNRINEYIFQLEKYIRRKKVYTEDMEE